MSVPSTVHQNKTVKYLAEENMRDISFLVVKNDLLNLIEKAQTLSEQLTIFKLKFFYNKAWFKNLKD
jgi:tmRNA-binding protein